MEKGLRQGDPLALFLFLIVVETFHILMSEAKVKGVNDGIKVLDEEMEVSYL